MRNVSSWISKFPVVWKHFEPITSIRVNYSNISFNESSPEEFTQKAEASINEVKLLGRVADEPALSQDNRFIMFSLKTKAWSKSDSDGQPQHPVESHSIITFQPNMIKSVNTFVKKGQRLYISGRLSYNIDKFSQKRNAYILLHQFICLSP